MPTAVITGCDSGIGHAFAEVLLKEGYYVYALDLNAGEKLKGLQGKNCQIGRLDVTDIESIWEFKKSIGEAKIDVLLNIAGIMLPPPTDALETVTLQTLQKTFAINTYGPLLLTQALLPNVLASVGGDMAPIIAVTSSRVGSLADNSSGGLYAYRSSKTAVNSIFKNLSVELKDKGVVVSMLHPGFTKTNLDKDIWKIPDAIFPDEAASKLWGVLKSKKIEDTGKFWHREGQELPW